MGETVDAEITVLDKDVAVVNEEIYEVLGTDQASIDGYLSELDRIEARLMGLLNLSDEALFDKRDEVNSMEDRTEEMKKDVLANLPDAKTKFRNIDQLLERINARMPRKTRKALYRRSGRQSLEYRQEAFNLQRCVSLATHLSRKS